MAGTLHLPQMNGLCRAVLDSHHYYDIHWQGDAITALTANEIPDGFQMASIARIPCKGTQAILAICLWGCLCAASVSASAN